MKIIQLLTTVSFGDAVSNDAFAIKDILKKNGFQTDIYAENIDKRLADGMAKSVYLMPQLSPDDIILYHLSTGTALNEKIKMFHCRKVMIYHNITPPRFFAEYSINSYQLCDQGLKQAESLKDTFDYVLADSDFNKKDLIRMGYTCPIDVLPILIKFEDYEKKPNSLVKKKYQDDYKNFLFVGRIAPNKKQEDVIQTFYYYNKYYNPKSRLFIVGSYNGMELYYERLKDYVEKLEVPNVIFPGHIKFDEILAYYKLADVFVCMSEHEGFCVPLVEAMYFDVPIVAYDSCAIAGTLGQGGILLKEKNLLEAAGVINRLLTDENLSEAVCKNQAEQLKRFDNRVIANQFMTFLRGFMDEK